MKKTTMQPEQLIEKVTEMAEEKNLKEAFMNDKTTGTARVNMG